MNYRFSYIVTFLVLFLWGFNPAQACDQSDVKLDSVVFTGGKYNLYFTLNIGGGVTGANLGANNSTRTFAFNFYGPTGMALSGYTTSLTSDSTGAEYWGTDFGPYLGSVFAVGYVDPGTDYTCITNTADCGNVHIDTKQVVISTNIMPDSMRVLGIEGAGNPVGGCYPNADMAIHFAPMPVVWAGFGLDFLPGGISLNWGTLEEVNCSHFTVMRSGNGNTFEKIAEITASGGISSVASDYSFMDEQALPGMNYYKIVQIDFNGSSSETQILSIENDVTAALSFIAVSPVPAKDFLNVRFNAGQGLPLNIQVLDIQGRMMFAQQIQAASGSNEISLDLNNYAAGMYVVSINDGIQAITKKIIKQ